MKCSGANLGRTVAQKHDTGVDMAFEDAGYMEGGPVGVKVGPPERRKYYPSFILQKDNNPKVEVGDTVEAKVKLRVKSIDEREGMNSKKTHFDCRFEVRAIDFGGGRETDGEEMQDAIESGLKSQMKGK